MKLVSDQIQERKFIIEFQLFNLIDELGISVKKDHERKIFIYALLYVQLMHQPYSAMNTISQLEPVTTYEKIKISYYTNYLSTYLSTSYSQERERIISIISKTFIDSINPEMNLYNFNDFVTMFAFKKLLQQVFHEN